MPQAKLTQQARNDLLEIWLHIAADSPTAADRFVDKIEARCRLLSRQPRLGEARPELADGLRCFPVGNYVVFYQPRTDGIEIVRVISGARDIDALF
jgi:toxin ParE1/3/4